MHLRKESLDEFLLRTILFVDADQRSIEFFSGILATMRANPDAGRIEAAGVTSLDAAKDYIENNKPYILILDPILASIKDVLAFIAFNRTMHPRMVWVINTADTWWRRHDKMLEADEFGRRVKDYFRLNKDASRTQRRADFVTTLTLCQYDLVLGLLGETTEEMRQSAVEMTRPQVAKFAGKALSEIRALKKILNDRPERGDVAVVSMKPAVRQEEHSYRSGIERVLKAAGFKPVMIPHDEPACLDISLSLFEQIEASGLFIADISEFSPCVLVEYGAASVLQKPTILLVDEATAAARDLSSLGSRVFSYSSDQALARALRRAIKGVIQLPEKT